MATISLFFVLTLFGCGGGGVRHTGPTAVGHVEAVVEVHQVQLVVRAAMGARGDEAPGRLGFDRGADTGQPALLLQGTRDAIEKLSSSNQFLMFEQVRLPRPRAGVDVHSFSSSSLR